MLRGNDSYYDFIDYFDNRMSSATRKAFLATYSFHITVETYSRIFSPRSNDRYCGCSPEDLSPTIITEQLAKLGPDFPTHIKNLEVESN
jgi:hypothetical protein